MVKRGNNGYNLARYRLVDNLFSLFATPTQKKERKIFQLSVDDYFLGMSKKMKKAERIGSIIFANKQKRGKKKNIRTQNENLP